MFNTFMCPEGFYSFCEARTVKRALSILGCGSNLIDYISSESKQFSIKSGNLAQKCCLL